MYEPDEDITMSPELWKWFDEGVPIKDGRKINIVEYVAGYFHAEKKPYYMSRAEHEEITSSFKVFGDELVEMEEAYFAASAYQSSWQDNLPNGTM